MGLFDRRLEQHAHDIAVALPLLRSLYERQGNGPEDLGTAILYGESLAIALRGEDGWPPGTYAVATARGAVETVVRFAYRRQDDDSIVLATPGWVEKTGDANTSYFDLGAFAGRCQSARGSGRLRIDDLVMRSGEVLELFRGARANPDGEPESRGWGCTPEFSDLLVQASSEAYRLAESGAYAGTPDEAPPDEIVVLLPSAVAHVLKTEPPVPKGALPSRETLRGWQKTAREFIRQLKADSPDAVSEYVRSLSSRKDRKLIESM